MQAPCCQGSPRPGGGKTHFKGFLECHKGWDRVHLRGGGHVIKGRCHRTKDLSPRSYQMEILSKWDPQYASPVKSDGQVDVIWSGSPSNNLAPGYEGL